jgi:hypothetical protein
MAAKTGTYTLITRTVVASSAASVTLSSIPGVYTDLELIVYVPGTAGITQMSINYNASYTGYSRTHLFSNGSTAQSVRATAQTQAYVAITNDATTAPQMLKASFLDYSNTTTYKTLISRWSAPTGAYVTSDVNLWQNTSAITSLIINAVVNNFAVGTTVSLYGIEAAK